MVPNKIHIGKIIEERMKSEGRSVSWLASNLRCTRTNIYKIYAKPSLNTEILYEISIILKFNFFSALNNATDEEIQNL